MVIARRCRISGTVQGVGFRYWMEREAVRLGVIGWVRNVASGVEAVVQGDAAAVEAMIALLHEGPRGAWVQFVDVSDVDPEATWERFEVRY